MSTALQRVREEAGVSCLGQGEVLGAGDAQARCSPQHSQDGCLGGLSLQSLLNSPPGWFCQRLQNISGKPQETETIFWNGQDLLKSLCALVAGLYHPDLVL